MPSSGSRAAEHTMPLSSSRYFSWLVFLVSALAGIGLFFVPALVIRPFSHQTPRALALAMSLRQHAPWGTLIAAIVCAIFALMLWQGGNRHRKIALCSIMFLVAFSAVMSRLNYFEWMFHPVDSPNFESEAASKLDASEMIMAVRFGGDARAYPIREMAYHHILNDVVNGTPVAVTY